MSLIAPTLQSFFTDRLAKQRRASPRTIASYRDSLKLLVVFVNEQTGKKPCDLDWDHLDTEMICAFLDHLEADRRNSARTRNLRLTAIRSLFTYASLRHPEHAALIQRVLAIPAKRFDKPLVSYLTAPEIDALIDAPDRTRWEGRRDRALLLVAVQSGLRVSELTGLDCGDVSLGAGASLRCNGKGRKHRAVPLTSATEAVLKVWLAERAGRRDEPLFPTRTGRRLSVDAVERLVTVTRIDERSSVLEVGCGTGQATRSLAALGCSVTAIEPGAEMAAIARQRLATFRNVKLETSTFEEWDDRGGRFDDVLVAASAWYWVDPSIGWQRAHDVLHPGGWMALLGNVVVRRPGEPEVYAETADLHERFSPGNPDWGHPPLEDDVRTTDDGWGLVEDPGGLFGPTIVRWYPTVQCFNGEGFADLLRSTSLYRRLDRGVREPLLDAIAERIRTRMDDRASRRYLSVLRVG